jgi:hypothetical protein
MITKDELDKVSGLESKRITLEGVLRGFSSKHVRSVIGLVEVNDASQYKVDLNDEANFIHNLRHIESELTLRGIELIEVELLHVKADIAKYIKG